MKGLDHYRGCLVGGAVGDALGYEVEFLSAEEIFAKYGPGGIRAYTLTNGVAEISDDTQMTLFTANGLLLAEMTSCAQGLAPNYLAGIAIAYQDWLSTQTAAYPLDRASDSYRCWLVHVPELFHRRAPGHTCLSALAQGGKGTMGQPINTNKGCGGIMRVAPIGLYLGAKEMSITAVNEIAAGAAALTHGHALGYMPAAALVHVLQLILRDDGMTLSDAVRDMRETMAYAFAQAKHLPTMLALIDRAIVLAETHTDDLHAIKSLGEGWVGEETLAIALYCALKYQDDFTSGIIAAVNHSGDSDSTGAVTGNILGAYLGYDAIPQDYLAHLELQDIILEIAEDLYQACQTGKDQLLGHAVWQQKYVAATYQPPQDLPKSTRGEVVILPTFAQLAADVAQLRADLALRFAERDQLQLVACENIEMSYLLTFGALEHKVYHAQCKALRLKRKIELIQAKLNRQEKILLAAIDTILDEEFAVYQEKLAEQIQHMSDALTRSTAACLTEDESKECKQLYRTIVKHLHPDLHPEISDGEIALFKNAITAYEDGDLAALRIIHELVGGGAVVSVEKDGLSHLFHEKERLGKLLATIDEEIAQIKSTYPYKMKDLLSDPAKIAAYKEALMDSLAHYEAFIQTYTSRIAEMMRPGGEEG